MDSCRITALCNEAGSILQPSNAPCLAVTLFLPAGSQEVHRNTRGYPHPSLSHVTEDARNPCQPAQGKPGWRGLVS